MEEDEALKQNIIARLNAVGIEFESQKKNIQALLYGIEGIAENTKKQIEDAENTLQKNPLSISALANTLHKSRTTLSVNSPAVKSFIAAWQEELNAGNPYETIRRLREENKKLSDTLEAAASREFDKIKLETQNKRLVQEINEYKKNNERLNERNKKLNAELTEMNDKLIRFQRERMA